MSKIKRNDIVQVIAGRDKGKKGKVLGLSFKDNRAIVEGINLVKKHQRRRQQDQQQPQTGTAQVPSPINLSNLILICKNCNKPSRIGFKVLADKAKSRICKRCKEPI